jgi:uncharacterized protein (TIGR00725 family)
MSAIQKLRIGICGSAHEPYDQLILKKAYSIGKEIALSNSVIYSGATYGYPYKAAQGAYENGGVSIGISPADTVGDHVDRYELPIDVFHSVFYTGMGFMGRNALIIRSCDAVIFIGGGVGTLNEFTVAFKLGLPLGLLGDSGRIAEHIQILVDICKTTAVEPPVIVESDDVRFLFQYMRHRVAYGS